jgi:hypothetical protein
MEGSAPHPGDEPALMPSSAEQQAAPAPKSLVPAKYGDPKTSGLNINVKEGMAGVDLSLSSQ